MTFDQNENGLVREQLAELLKGGFAPVVTLLREFHYDKTGIVLDGLHFSAYSLLGHMHHRQSTLLKFMKDPEDNLQVWPEAYWPKDHVPDNEQAWHNAIGNFENDLEAMIQIVKNPDSRLFEVQKNGKTRSWAAMTTLHHNSYHIGQIKAVGRQLGVW